MKKHEIQAIIDSLGLSIKTEFIPFSQSRNKGEKHPSLNYAVSLLKNGKVVLSTDYMMGCAHVPGYKQMDRSIDHANMIKRACETGKTWRELRSTGSAVPQQPILPDIVDVMYSLVSDSDVINYSSFEDWAENFGYDSDSRNAERIYRQCLEIALALRNAIGDNGMTELQNAFQGY